MCGADALALGEKSFELNLETHSRNHAASARCRVSIS